MVRYLRLKAAQHRGSAKRVSQEEAAQTIGVSRRAWQFWETEESNRPAPASAIISFAALMGIYPSGEEYADWLGRMELEASSQGVE